MRKDLAMVRLVNIFRIMFNRYGLLVFFLCFTSILILYLPGIPELFAKPVMEVVGPYLLAILQMGVLINSIAVLLMVHFVIKVLSKKNYTIKVTVLSLLIAFFIMQWFSLFCLTMYPQFSNVPEATYRFFEVYVNYKIEIVEEVGLGCTIYLLAFYMGALSRKKFKVNVILLGKLKKNT
ncbi:hypothetical protein [Solibacillus sp. FSL H8-0538]|uniref:hypothetical protein n=1 Tax=Solibacillus sp. FSL H8-0538 TaxID=2921400 RepID=UPI0030F7465B